MRRSTQVVAPILVSAAAAILTGCGPEMQRCVDQQNHVVDPRFCQNLPPAAATAPAPYTGNPHIIVLPQYRYYYGGGGGYSLGSIVTGGSYAPLPGHDYSLTKGTTRGGFGELFGGGFGGEGGGE